MSVCSCRSLAEGCSLPGTPGVAGSRYGKRRRGGGGAVDCSGRRGWRGVACLRRQANGVTEYDLGVPVVWPQLGAVAEFGYRIVDGERHACSGMGARDAAREHGVDFRGLFLHCQGMAVVGMEAVAESAA